MGALAAVVFIALFGGAIATRIVGHDGYETVSLRNELALRPVGPWTHVPETDEINIDSYGNVLAPDHPTKQALLVLGADGPLGRDELIRVLDGARTSLEIALGAVLVALLIAVPVGAVAGYYGGGDRHRRRPLHGDGDGVSPPPLPRLRDRQAQPVAARRLVRLGPAVGRLRRGAPDRDLHLVLPDEARPRAAPHPAKRRVRRGQPHDRSSDSRILRRHLLPHLVPTLLVWAPIAVATNILLEVGLSFIGVGVQPSTPTWGSLLATAWGTVYSPQAFGHAQTAWQTIIPTTAILITVLSLNQVSEGIRRAIEPWGRH